MTPSPIEIEIINIDSPKELPKNGMDARVEGKDSTWRPTEGHWFKWVDSFGCIHWHRDTEA